MPVRPLVDMYTRLSTCSDIFTHVHTCSRVFTHAHTCAHMLTHVHTYSTCKHASRSQHLQVSYISGKPGFRIASFICGLLWLLHMFLFCFSRWLQLLSCASSWLFSPFTASSKMRKTPGPFVKQVLRPPAGTVRGPTCSFYCVLQVRLALGLKNHRFVFNDFWRGSKRSREDPQEA